MTELLTATPRTLSARSAHRSWLAPALVGLAGTLFSSLAIGTPSIWYDEAATISSSTRSWSQLVAEVQTVDLVHGLYYALMHLWFDLVGYSPLTLRLPSALAIGAAAALVVVLGRLLSRERLGVIAGILFLLLPRSTWAGGEGRSYALTATLAVATTVLVVLAARAGHRRWWVVYGIVGVLACVTFIYLALVIVAHLATLAWLRRRDRRLNRALGSWAIAAAASAPLLALFGWGAMGQSRQVAWLPEVGSSTVRAVVSTQWFFDSPVWTVAGWVALVAGAIALATLRQHRWLAATAVPGMLLPTLAILAVSVAITPLYNPRYLTMSLPFVALVMAAAFDLLPSPRRPMAIAALVIAAAISVPTLVDQRQPTSKEGTDWATVSQLIADQRDDDGPGSTAAIVYDRVRYHPRATARVIAYAYPEGFTGTVDVTLQTSAAESGRLWETTRPLSASLSALDNADVVYLLTSTASDGTRETAATLSPLGWSISDSWVLSDVRIVRFENGS